MLIGELSVRDGEGAQLRVEFLFVLCAWMWVVCVCVCVCVCVWCGVVQFFIIPKYKHAHSVALVSWDKNNLNII